MTDAVVALGANLGQPQQQLVEALRILQRHTKISLLDVSSLYRSAPMGPQDQPDYINAVCVIDSQLSAAETLQTLHSIESEFGRTRQRHWGERTLDLDLVLFGQESSSDAALTLPHPGLYARAFVLYPLAEIAPDYLLPNQRTVLAQAQRVPKGSLDMVLSRAVVKTRLA